MAEKGEITEKAQNPRRDAPAVTTAGEVFYEKAGAEEKKYSECINFFKAGNNLRAEGKKTAFPGRDTEVIFL